VLRRFALTLTLMATAAQAELPRVVVVKSAGLAAYAHVVAGFAAEARGAVEELTLEEGAEPAQLFKGLARRQPALVLAIGPAAAVAARRELPDVPVLFVMVPYFQKYELEGPNTTGIALTSDLSSELRALKALLPQVTRVGVVNDPKYSKQFIEAASEVAQAQGLALVSLELDAAAKVDKVLAGAKGRLDALVVISDRTVGSAGVVERLLQYSSAEKVPVIGLAPAQVKQGALLALAPSPLATGLQAGRLANRVLVEKVDPGAVAVASPEGVELHVNLTAARRLGLGEGFAGQVLAFAARQGLAIKVTE
jgi:putative ABC transport system substrate-binding protein